MDPHVVDDLFDDDIQRPAMAQHQQLHARRRQTGGVVDYSRGRNGFVSHVGMRDEIDSNAASEDFGSADGSAVIRRRRRRNVVSIDEAESLRQPLEHQRPHPMRYNVVDDDDGDGGGAVNSAAEEYDASVAHVGEPGAQAEPGQPAVGRQVPDVDDVGSAVMVEPRARRRQAGGPRRRVKARRGGGGGGGGDDDDDGDVVPDYTLLPLDGYAWVDDLPPRETAFCYVCNTPAAPDDQFLREVNSLLAMYTRIGEEHLCRLVFKIYEGAIRYSTKPPKPQWAIRTIYEHIKYHAATHETVAMDTLRVSQAMLQQYVRTARRVDTDGKDVAPDGNTTKAMLNIMSMRLRAAAQLHTAVARSTGVMGPS